MKQNVLHLVSSFGQGGTEQQMVQLVQLLVTDAQYRVHVAAFNSSGPLRKSVERLLSQGIAEFPLTSFYNLNAVRQLSHFVRFLRHRKIDVIHTHDFYSNVFGLAGGFLARVPVRIASKRETGGVRTPAQSFVERLAFHLAHAIIANSEAVQRELCRQGVSKQKVVKIYNGLDSTRVAARDLLTRHEVLASFGLPVDGNLRFVSIIANMRLEVKDHPTFLRAAKRVREVIPWARFALAGEGDLERLLRQLAHDLGIANDVFFVGHCSRIAEFLSVADVCVLSSKAEGFSNAILEYMAAGRPVVVTDVGGAREVVEEGLTGHIVPPEDAGQMADRIVSLLSDPQRAAVMGDRGRHVVESRFSRARQLECTKELYGRLVQRNFTRSSFEEA